MSVPDKRTIVDAARALVTLVRAAPESELDAAFQVIANSANDSEYAAHLEPYQGICQAIFAEQRRRAYEAREPTCGYNEHGAMHCE